MKDFRIGGGRPEAAYAEGRVGLLAVCQKRERLVGAGIQCPHHYAATIEGGKHGTVRGDLLRDRGRLGPIEEAKFRAV
jgi:hypothetical protein